MNRHSSACDCPACLRSFQTYAGIMGLVFGTTALVAFVIAALAIWDGRQ